MSGSGLRFEVRVTGHRELPDLLFEMDEIPDWGELVEKYKGYGNVEVTLLNRIKSAEAINHMLEDLEEVPPTLN